MSALSTHTDEHLLELLQRNDEAAFTELYNRYWKTLFGIAYHHFASKETAEDIVHEIFAALWKRRHHLNIVSFGAWIATAAKYMVVAYKNRELKKELFSNEMPEASEENTRLQLDLRFLSEQLQREVAALPDRCRLIFTASRERGLSNAAIAHELNISEKAVEKQLNLARQRLRLALRNFFLMSL